MLTGMVIDLALSTEEDRHDDWEGEDGVEDGEPKHPSGDADDLLAALGCHIWDRFRLGAA